LIETKFYSRLLWQCFQPAVLSSQPPSLPSGAEAPSGPSKEEEVADVHCTYTHK